MLTRQDFIAKYGQDNIDATIGTGFFPSVSMAQMIIESADSAGNAGNGITARLANNFFGIKADQSWTGEKIAFNTPKDGSPVNYFRKYANAKESIADHIKFLKDNSRYAAHGVFTAKTPEEQTAALQAAGYAEGSDGHGAGYANALNAVIRGYNLKSLDNEVSTTVK